MKITVRDESYAAQELWLNPITKSYSVVPF